MSVKLKIKQLTLSALMASLCMPFQYANATETIVVIGKRPGGPSVDDLRDAVNDAIDRDDALRHGDRHETQMEPIDVVAVEITSLDTRCHPDGSQALSTDSLELRYRAAHDTFVATTEALGVSRSSLYGKKITIIYGDGGRQTFSVMLSSTAPLVPDENSIVLGSGKATPGCGKKG